MTVTLLLTGSARVDGVVALMTATACAASALQIASTFTWHVAPAGNGCPTAQAAGPPLAGGCRGKVGLVG